MTEFRGVLGLQVESLLAALRREQESRCRELIRQAEAQAKDLLRQSRRQLRERGRQAVQEERKRREVALQQARYRLRAAQSRKVQALYAELLRKAWPLLNRELERRWTDVSSRRAWCDKLLHEAEDALAHGTWTIAHPEDWSGRDARWLGAVLKDRGMPEPLFRSDPACSAGLKISSGTACLDGTIDGLLARRGRVQGRLLAAWEEPARQASRERHG